MNNSPKDFVQAAAGIAKHLGTIAAAGAVTACTVYPAYPGVSPGYVRVAPAPIVVTVPVPEPVVLIPYGGVVVVDGYAARCRALNGCLGHGPRGPHGHFRY